MNEYYSFSGEMESQEKSELTVDEMRTIARGGLTREGFSSLLDSEHFAEGSYALLFEVPDSDPQLVAKVWKNPKHDSGRASNENTALRLLRVRDFKHAPEARGYLKPSQVLFEEKIEGTPVEQFDKDVIERLAIALAELHSIKLKKYGKPLTKRKEGTRLDYFHDAVETLRKLALSFADQSEITDTINRSLDKMEIQASETGNAFSETDFTLIHFDLNKGNILYSKEKESLAIIDWEQASAGDNAMDIAKLFLKSEFDSDQRRVFLEQYKSHQLEEDLNLEERIQLYEPFVLANSVVWRLGVLQNAPQQTSSEDEEIFYHKVKNKLETELEALRTLYHENHTQ